MYKEPVYDVAVERGRVYAKGVKGHWSSYPDTGGDFGDIYINKVKDLAFSKDLDLDMDQKISHMSKGMQENKSLK